MGAVDIIIHVHPEFSAEDRQKVETALATLDGILSVHFSPGHPRAMTVVYDRASEQLGHHPCSGERVGPGSCDGGIVVSACSGTDR